MTKRKFDITFGDDMNKRIKSMAGEELENSSIEMDIFGLGNTVDIKDNHIYFYGAVNNKNCLKINIAIKELNKKLKNVQNNYEVSTLRIYLHINSYGGSVFSCLSTIDTILRSPIPIISVIEGCAASAATLISVSCHERVISENSFMLIHQISSSFWGKMEEIKDEFINLKKLTKKIKNIYKKYTKLSNEQGSKVKLNDVLKRDLWWDSDECLKYGLADRKDI